MATYTDTAKVAAFLQLSITSSTTPSSQDVEQWITEAEAVIDQKVGHSFTTSTTTGNVSSSNSSKDFWLPKDFLPLVSVDSLEVNAGSDFDQDWTELVEGTNFLILDTITGHIKFSPNTIVKAIEQSIRFGVTYGNSSVPANVTALATQMAARTYLSSALMNVSVETNEKITLGPIRIESGSSNASLVLKQMDDNIKSQLESLGHTKSYIY